jgi:hypothetical protein
MCPCGIATATPQHFTVASRQTSTRPPRSYPTSQNAADRIAHRNRPISARFGAGKPLRDVEAGSCPYSFPSRSPDPHHLAVLTRPGFVRAAPTRTRHLTSHGCPQLHRPAATGSAVVVSHFHSNKQRLTVHVVQAQVHFSPKCGVLREVRACVR